MSSKLVRVEPTLLHREKKEENADKFAKKNSDWCDIRAYLYYKIKLVSVTVYKVGKWINISY
jgi:hypothetical protein